MPPVTDTLAPVITIDGPSASGKGTVSVMLARNLGWHFLDSGALYRLVAYAALQQTVALDDVPGLERTARNLDVVFKTNPGSTEISTLLAGQDVTMAIRTEQAGNAASTVAVVPQVRTALLDRQRAFRQLPGLVADGRDMGSVVFPDATLKIFLTASAEERAKRRYKQLMEKGASVNLRDLFEEIAERDRRDSQRATAPLQAAADAVLVDTTQLTIEGVVEQILALYHQR